MRAANTIPIDIGIMGVDFSSSFNEPVVSVSTFSLNDVGADVGAEVGGVVIGWFIGGLVVGEFVGEAVVGSFDGLSVGEFVGIDDGKFVCSIVLAISSTSPEERQM
mmetsp:Transcript_10665/g.13917  ORF Transcript_10665/g.13917 Transcript_10665/m.13917 type:complete len:106 (-) Transcript_10665:161-478(-)|eukprot:CAMPEP_0204868812 /NCGR_PEP_ID=MMETSP1348-20121228/27973_1 /ASSEMBLY_ACC=CAM_ASM_000700 /TAXON_ID=215587 /ORGANISM="Aplanochytrium stocchinoi, Strain GSBS06" /LENGTH=105 /DNA_ID=CAMNT_0052021915 /DNA_START=514 /DNA_END=831 /DNA_ORIENTATION=+